MPAIPPPRASAVASRTKTASILSAIYSTQRTFTPSTVASLLKAHVFHGDPQGGVLLEAPTVGSTRGLRDWITNTFPQQYSTYPDPTGGLLRVSVLHKRPDPTVSPDPRMSRDDMGIDLDDLGMHHGEFLMGFEGVWQVSDENADLAVARGSHLLASLRGYTHPSMVRKIVGWDRIDGLVWFHTASPAPAVLKWIGTGVVLPPDDSTNVWGWAVPPKPLPAQTK